MYWNARKIKKRSKIQILNLNKMKFTDAGRRKRFWGEGGIRRGLLSCICWYWNRNVRLWSRIRISASPVVRVCTTGSFIVSRPWKITTSTTSANSTSSAATRRPATPTIAAHASTMIRILRDQISLIEQHVNHNLLQDNNRWNNKRMKIFWRKIWYHVHHVIQ